MQKNRPKYFLDRKVCLFFINLCFQQSLRCQGNDPKTSTVIVKLLSGPYILSLRFITINNARKIWPKLFFTGKIAFFIKTFVFNNVLGPKELILDLPQKFSNYLVDPFRVVP